MNYLFCIQHTAEMTFINNLFTVGHNTTGTYMEQIAEHPLTLCNCCIFTEEE